MPPVRARLHKLQRRTANVIPGPVPYLNGSRNPLFSCHFAKNRFLASLGRTNQATQQPALPNSPLLRKLITDDCFSSPLPSMRRPDEPLRAQSPAAAPGHEIRSPAETPPESCRRG